MKIDLPNEIKVNIFIKKYKEKRVKLFGNEKVKRILILLLPLIFYNINSYSK